MDSSVPRSKRLLTDDRSNIFVYMTGHGGNEFLKFQDNEEISAFDIADAFEQMWQKKRSVRNLPGGFNNYKSHSCRYNEIFFMIDTCQANTMFSKFYSPNILATGSSEIRENSYSVDLMRALHFMKLTVWCNSTRMTMTSASPSSIVSHIISSNSWKVLTRRVSRQCRT